MASSCFALLNIRSHFLRSWASLRFFSGFFGRIRSSSISRMRCRNSSGAMGERGAKNISLEFSPCVIPLVVYRVFSWLRFSSITDGVLDGNRSWKRGVSEGRGVVFVLFFAFLSFVFFVSLLACCLFAFSRWYFPMEIRVFVTARWVLMYAEWAVDFVFSQISFDERPVPAQPPARKPISKIDKKRNFLSVLRLVCDLFVFFHIIMLVHAR